MYNKVRIIKKLDDAENSIAEWKQELENSNKDLLK